MPFDQITSGPSGPTNGNNNSPGLTLDTTNNIVASVGTSHTESIFQATLALFQGLAALTTITAAQNLISKALGSYLLNRAGRTIRVKGWFIYTSPGTTTPTITVALVLGATTLCTITTAALSSTASTNMPVQFEFVFSTVTTGATGTIEAHGSVSANISANTPAAATVQYSDTNTAVSSAVNLQSALTLAVTLAASSTITSAQLRLGTIEIVG